MPDHLELYGCRHDIRGHYRKAIGLPRVLDFPPRVILEPDTDAGRAQYFAALEAEPEA